MARLSRRKALSLSLVSLTSAGCVFQEGDWGTTVRIGNSIEGEVTAHVEIFPESGDEPLYETEQTLEAGGETEENVRLQTDANKIRIVVEVDHPEERTIEDRGKSGWDEIWIQIFEDKINTGGSSTM